MLAEFLSPGELGGMGLIRNAIEQGRQAVESVCTRYQQQRIPTPWIY